MRVSIDWLKEFVEINETPEVLADLLSNSGLESEVTDVPLEIPGVIIGKVESAIKHPDADKLKLCMVNDGDQIHQVVCGAPNVDSGQIIAFATVGAVLPGNFKIKNAKIRGVESHGMICSERELNISDEHEGIMVLPNDLKLGQDFMKAYGNKFLSLDLDITPNRPDAFSHQGVARDIACVTARDFSPIQIQPLKPKADNSIDISMENHIECPRYIGGLIEKAKVGPSPDWLVERLRSVGQRSINNIVDISNFVLMEIGHPTHIFDYDKLKNKEILVRKAKSGETLTTLDEQKHNLKEEHLLITDGNEPIALAGIMGGLGTAVSSTTQNLLIESAYFDAVTIRKCAKDLSMSTDASKRYERGADPNGCEKAFWRVVALVEELTGGALVSDAIDVYPAKIEPQSVKMRKGELELIIGINIQSNEVNKIFSGLGIEYIVDNDEWTCIIPTFRPDITREIDLIEEVARIHGFENIPADHAIRGSYRFNDPDPEKHLSAIRQTLVGTGFHQIYSNSLQSEQEASLSKNEPVMMMNPLNKDMGYLRTSLLPGLMKAADLNIKHSNTDIRIFELGHVHFTSSSISTGVEERKYLSGLVVGDIIGENVHSDPKAEDLFSLKSYLVTLFEKKLSMRMEINNTIDSQGFELARSVSINRQEVGKMGRISSDWIRSMGLDLETVYGFELNLEPLERMFGSKKSFKKVSPYPKIVRDLNLVMPEEQEVGSIIEIFHKKGKKLLINSKPVDVFMDEDSIGKNMKSVTFSLVFQDTSKTLEDKDVNPIIDEIIRVAKNDFNAKLRT